MWAKGIGGTEVKVLTFLYSCNFVDVKNLIPGQRCSHRLWLDTHGKSVGRGRHISILPLFASVLQLLKLFFFIESNCFSRCMRCFGRNGIFRNAPCVHPTGTEVVSEAASQNSTVNAKA